MTANDPERMRAGRELQMADGCTQMYPTTRQTIHEQVFGPGGLSHASRRPKPPFDRALRFRYPAESSRASRPADEFFLRDPARTEPSRN